MSTPTTAYAELEIGLHRMETATYQVELRFTDPGSEAEIPPARGTATFDPAELLALQQDPGAYGETLAERLFDDDNVRGLYLRAQTAVEASGNFLRLRLLVAPSAAELHALRWELLRDPESKTPLATSEKTPFSRFMVSHDWRPVKLRPRADLKALVAVSAPSNLAKYQLADVDRDGEIDRATTALAGIDVEVLGRDQPLSVEGLVERLRGGVDVLYLVCHGALIRQVPRLYLQNDDGEVAVADGNELAQRIAELPQAPRLVVLASCESAGAERGTSGDDRPSAQTALAPRLAEAGVPAILAMQGKITMTTVEKAMPAFFTELLKDGQIDRAMAVARGSVRDRPDAWMPALYLRLKRGRIWYVPGFGGDEDDFSKWRSITSSVRQGRFIPIVAVGVADHIFGSTRDLADRLAELHHFPMPAHERTDLAKVAQFLSVDQSRQYARDEVLKQAQKQILERYPELGGKRLSLPKLLDAVLARQEESDPFRILAELPASVYLTASPTPQLLKSLKAAGREPTPLLCDWRPTQDNHPQEPPYEGEPTSEKPIVYHVFGVLGKPNSMVLTEDDFFDFLIATSEYKLMPTEVRGALTRSSLLFLGFRLDELAFRALFRLIMTLGGIQQLRDYAHVGVQVDPEEHNLSDVEGMRKYLEGYFGVGGDAPPISIYWGSAADFLNELREQLKRTDDDEVPAAVEEDEDDWLC
ncbi:MAG: CHAT domain-containing protein [bacterium]|nr:CHAT domain-containing protein [bacterium]